MTISAASGRFRIDTIFRAVDELSGPVSRMQDRVAKWSRFTESGFKGLSRAADAYVSTVHSAAKVTAGAGVLLGTGLAMAAKAGIDFDQQMADVGAVSLATRDEIADLEAKARQLGSTTKFTATQAAAGMELMGKAGFKNAEILAGIEGVLNAAAAEGAELAETAGHVSNVLKGMGLEASEATHVADVLALASARTNSSISSLGEAMANVSSTARQFKIPLEQTVASVALLQDVGLDASVAGSALNTMLTKLADPTDKARESMRRLGVRFADAKGNMLPLTDVMQNLMKAMDKSKGNMGAVAFFAELVGLRGQKAAQNLADLFKTIDKDTGKSKVQTLFDELAHASDGVGSAAKMASLRMDTFRGDTLLLESAVEGLKIELFDLNKGPLREVVQGMTKWVEANKGLILSETAQTVKQIGENLPTIITWGTRIGKVAAGFYALSLAVKSVQLATDAWMVSSRLIGGVTASVRFLTSAMGLYNTELHLAGNGLAAMRARLNAGGLSMAINDVTSSLGKAGLLGAAFAVGYEFGSWIREITGADKAIADLMARIAGLEGRGADSKLTGRRMELTEGLVVDEATGKIVTLNAGGNIARRNELMARYEKWHKKWLERASRSFETPVVGPMTKAAPDQFKSRLPEAPSAFEALSKAPIQIVSPQERTARSIEEKNTTTTSTTEIVIKDETGRAEVRKRGKGAKVPVLRPTGT